MANSVRVIRRAADELTDTAIQGIVKIALEEQALLDRLADAVRAGDEQKIVEAARAVCHAEEDSLPPAA